jgi:hypothetical protein
MEQPSADHLDRRIGRLERSSRRDRLIGLAVMLVLVATAQAPAPGGSSPVVVRDATGASATLTAAGLVVRDAAGHGRVFAGLDSDGRPSFDLRDATGRLRQTLFLADGVPSLRQFDSGGNRRTEMRLDSKSNGELLLSDEHEKLRLALFRKLDAAGDPQLALYGSDEKIRAYFSTDDDSPYLVMRDASGATRVVMGGYTSGKIGIDIRSPANQTLWSAP